MNDIKKILYTYFNRDALEEIASDEQILNLTWMQSHGYQSKTPSGNGLMLMHDFPLTDKGKRFINESNKRLSKLKPKGLENKYSAYYEIMAYLKKYPNTDKYDGLDEVEKYALMGIARR